MPVREGSSSLLSQNEKSNKKTKKLAIAPGEWNWDRRGDHVTKRCQRSEAVTALASTIFGVVVLKGVPEVTIRP